MNTTQQTARVGLFFLLGVALVWVTFETLGTGGIFREKNRSLIAAFDDLKQLKPGDDVRMAGVKIGSVVSTRLAGQRGEAILGIDPGVEVPEGSLARIQMSGLIGGDLVAISPGKAGGPALAPGSKIDTEEAPDLNSVVAQLGGLGKQLQDSLGSLSKAFNGTGPDGGLFGKLDRLVTENSAKLTETVSNLQEITGKINRGEGTIGRLVNDPKLHDELLAAVEDIRTAVGQAKEFATNAEGVMNQIKSGQGTLGTLIYDQKSAENIKASIANLRDVSDKLARGEGTLGKLINDDSLYNNAQITVKKVDRTLDGLNDSGPITAVGIVVNSLF